MNYTSPQRIDSNDTSFKVFLAGTIDMGNSEDWQKTVEDKYKNSVKISFLNPRRKTWNNNLEQVFENPEFFQQVTWELDALEKSDLIIMNFLENSKSPITFLELGLFAKSKKLFIACPKNFYRRGNIEIICNKYSIPLFDNLDILLDNINLHLK